MQISDPKEVLTIFDKFMPRSKESGKKFYTDFFEKDESGKDKNLYRLLTKKEFGWQYMTTNIDLEIVRALAYNDDINENGLPQLGETEDSKKKENYNRFFKKHKSESKVIGVMPNESVVLVDGGVKFIHGIVDDIENSIFTTKDYLKTYFNGGSAVKDLLGQVFENYTVLFIGYGLSEFAILESIINFV